MRLKVLVIEMEVPSGVPPLGPRRDIDSLRVDNIDILTAITRVLQFLLHEVALLWQLACPIMFRQSWCI